MPTFTPPTLEDVPRWGPDTTEAEKAWLRHTRALPAGLTVLKKAGVYTQHRTPDPALVAAADVVYVGGHVYQVDDAEAAALQAAGYTTGA
jgi:hypothetical protein